MPIHFEDLDVASEVAGIGSALIATRAASSTTVGGAFALSMTDMPSI